MAIEAELADGTILEFPDGTDQGVIDRTVKRHVVESLATSRADTKAAPKAAPKVQTREDAIKERARREYEADRSKNAIKQVPYLGAVTDVLDSAGASAANFLGIGPRLTAGVRSLTKGTPFEDERIYAQERNRLERDQSLTGEVAGALAGGSGAIGAGEAALARLTSAAPRVGNFLSRTLTLQPNQFFRNAARITGTGAAGGAAQAVGEGEDAKTGAIAGAIAAPVATAALGTGRAIASRVRNFTRPGSRNLERAAQEVVTEDPAALAQRQQDLSAQAGSNVPLIGALNEQDLSNVTERLLKGSREANDVAKRETTNYIRGFMDRMIDVVDRAGTRSARAVNNQVTLPSGTQVGMPLQGTVNDLMRHRNDMASQMMDPIRNRPVDLSAFDTDDLERQLAQRVGGRIQGVAPRVNEALADLTPAQMQAFNVTPTDMRQARQMLHQWGLRGPVNITVGEADSLRRVLSAAGEATRKAGNTVDAAAYSNAADEIRRLVPYPEYGDMIDAYAANQRMIKGFETAAEGKRLSDISKQNIDADLRTPEGRIGMRIGELHRQREAVGKSPASAVSAARDYAAEGKLTRQANVNNAMAAQPGTVTENLGPGAAAELADASRVEYDALQRMLQAGRVDIPTNAADDNPLNSPETILYGISLLSPHTMAITRSRFFANLIRNMPSGFSPQVAENMTEMLFSRDPAQTQRALNALQRLGLTPQQVGSQITALAAGAAAGRDPDGNAAASPQPEVPQETPVEEPEPQASTEDQDFEDLASRMEQVESGGRQDAVSSAGAIGVMQVMPGTGPEAADLAGVEWDPKRFKEDEDYNRQLGRAYLKEMLRLFDGNETYAVAAYNGGPNKVRKAIEQGGDNWVSLLKPETQDYIQKVLG